MSVKLLTTAPQYFDLPEVNELDAKAGLTAGRSNLRLIEVPENLLERVIERLDEHFHCIIFSDNADQYQSENLIKVYKDAQLHMGAI